MDSSYTVYIIFAIALGYSLFSTFVMQILGNPKRIKEIQDESKRLSTSMQEAVKSKNEKRIADVNKEYEKLFPAMGEMMFLQLKPLIVIFPVLFVITPIIRDTFSSFVITIPISLPIFIQNFERFPNWRDTFGPIGWFWLCVIASGLSVSYIKGIWEKRKYGSKAKAAEDAGKDKK